MYTNMYVISVYILYKLRDWETSDCFIFSFIFYARLCFYNLSNNQLGVFCDKKIAILNEGATSLEDRGKIEIKRMGIFSHIVKVYLMLFNGLCLS